MFSFFKSKKNKPTTVKSTYYIREGLIHNVSDIANLLLPNKENNCVIREVDNEIKFKNLSLIGLTEKQIVTEMGEAVFTHDNSEIIAGHKVLYYKEDVEHYRFLIQFHFIEDEFFMVSNKVTSSGTLSDSEKSKIVNQIKSRYLANKTDANNSLVLSLTDKNGSSLNIVDNVYYYVNYLSGAPIKNKLVRQYCDSSVHKEKGDGFTESIDKYF